MVFAAPSGEIFGVLRGSCSPCGLYARQKWLGEEQTARWQEDFKRTVSTLRHGPQSNGLWENSPLATIRRLFGLHLTVRAADADIDRALEALLEFVQDPPSVENDRLISAQELAGLPFAPGRWGDIATPAVLFLGTIFGRDADGSLLERYRKIASDLSTARELKAIRTSQRHNYFRALAVHPDYAGHPTTLMLVAWYAARQNPQGDWGAAIPFYQALNALAHLETPSADILVRKAFDSLADRQNADGSWGREEREWKTFLTLHALRNKGRLPLSQAVG